MSDLNKAIDLIKRADSNVVNIGCSWVHVSRFDEAAQCLRSPLPQEVSMAISDVYVCYEDACNDLDQALRILKNLPKGE